MAHALSMLVSVSSKTNFERWGMFQLKGNHIFKVTTIKGKDMLSSIFFPLKVAPVRITFKGIELRKRQN